MAMATVATQIFLDSIPTQNNGRCAHARPCEQLLSITLFAQIIYHHCVCLIIIVSWSACRAYVRTRVCLCCRAVLVYVIIPGAFDGGLPLIALRRPREPSDVLVYFLSDEKAGGGFRDKNFFKETQCFCLTHSPTQSFKNTVYPQEFPNTASIF